MQRSLLLLCLFGLLSACASNPAGPAGPSSGGPEQTGPSSSENVGAIAEPASTTVEPTSAPADSPALEPEAAFVVVYEAMRDGDWDRFAPFAGASIRYLREVSIGEVPREERSIPPAEARAWLDSVRATWAPECMDRPDPPCRGFNPLSLGVDDPAELQLRCVETGAEGALCCEHQAALLHNTPFLVQVCFDEEQRVTQLSILDG